MTRIENTRGSIGSPFPLGVDTTIYTPYITIRKRGHNMNETTNSRQTDGGTGMGRNIRNTRWIRWDAENRRWVEATEATGTIKQSWSENANAWVTIPGSPARFTEGN